MSSSDTTSFIKAKALYRRAWFSGLLAIALLIAGCYGFYLGWKMVKRPVLLVMAFNRVTNSHQRAQDISPADLDSILSRLKTHEYQAIEPDRLADVITKDFQGRSFLLAFKGGFAETSTETITILQKHAIKAIFFVNPGKIGLPGHASPEQLIELQKHGNIGLTIDAGEKVAAARDLLATKLNAEVPFFAYPERVANNKQEVASAGFKLALICGTAEIPANPDSLVMPMIEYIKGAQEIGEPSPTDWLPPKSARNGALSVTLSILVFFIALGWCLKAFAFLKAAKAHSLKNREEKAG